MSTCAIKWCGKSSRTSNYQNDGITFHRFPRDPDRKEKWIKATSRGDMWFPKLSSVICSRHFTEDTFYPMKNRRRLMDTAVPTLYLPILAPAASPISATVPSTCVTGQRVEAENQTMSVKPYVEEHDVALATSPISSTVTSTCVTGQRVEAEDQTLSVKPFVEEHDVGVVSVRPDSKTLKPTEADIASTPRKKRSISPIAMSPSAYNSPVKKRLCRRVIELTNTINIKNKNLRKLRDSNRRLKRQIVSLKSLLEELEKKDLITSENNVVMNSLGVQCREIVQRQMLKGKSGTVVKKKYSPQLRAFALTLCFYSTKAYNYVRKTFDTCLPSIKTLGKWYRSVDGHPGFTKEAFHALKSKAEQSPTPIHCCIVFDEMKIESKVEKTFGYIDFGGNIDSDCRDECTDALVFLVVPLHEKWKVPIGYFMINKINADQKKFLLTQAIELCNEANIVVKAVTFDGCPTNLAMAKKLGCSFEPNNIKSTFKVQNNEIAVFLDPAHMVKLVRNSFEFYKEFKDSEGNDIKWSHLEMLNKLQEEEKFHAANKLRSEHLLFKKNIMKVKLATQLFSRSVAIALLFCKNTLRNRRDG